MSIPEGPGEATYPKIRVLRTRLNSAIQAWADAHVHVSYCDFAGSLPQAQPALWDDGLQLSKQGYDELRVLVARHMANAPALDGFYAIAVLAETPLRVFRYP